jgi:hypothetical protein
MKKRIALLKNFIFFMFFTSTIYGHECTCAHQDNSTNLHSVHLNDLEKLKIVENQLLLDMGDGYFSIQSIQKLGDEWVVAFNGYCPHMHLLCECGQCHYKGCYYFTRYCPRGRN